MASSPSMSITTFTVTCRVGLAAKVGRYAYQSSIALNLLVPRPKVRVDVYATQPGLGSLTGRLVTNTAWVFVPAEQEVRGLDPSVEARLRPHLWRGHRGRDP